MNGDPIKTRIFELGEKLSLLLDENDNCQKLISCLKDASSRDGIRPFDMLHNLDIHGYEETVDQFIKIINNNNQTDTDLHKDILNFYANSAERFIRGIDIISKYLKKYPDNPNIYSFLSYAYKYKGERTKVIQILKKGHKESPYPIFFQSSALHDLSDQVLTALVEELNHTNNLEHLADARTAILPPHIRVSLETRGAQEIGMDRAVLSAHLENASSGGEYCFEYGASSDDLNLETNWRPLPPGVFSEVRDTTLSTFSNWFCYGTTHEFSVDPCAISSQWPFAIDRNHLDGVGQVTLLYGWRPSSLPPENTPLTSSRFQSLDLRGGKISFKVRHRDMDAKGGRLVLGLGSHFVGRRIGQPSKPWMASQWMMTGKPIFCEDTKDDGWTCLTFNIEADPGFWAYGSNNRAEQDNSSRYDYLPLSQMVAHHNGNVTVSLMFADEKEMPEGKITLREGCVTYRDWSMLRTENGGELVDFPGEDRNAALKLTNGQYRNQADGWHHAREDASTPCRFVWSLPQHSRLDGIVLIQHPRYPVRLAQVFLRNGGTDGAVVHAGLISFPDPGFDQPKRFFVSVPATVSATHVEVNLMQGQTPEGPGLMGVEAFGHFSPKPTLVDALSVCEDIADLEPGSRLFYRLVYRDENGIVKAEIKSLQIPGDRTALLHDLKPLEDDDRAWLVHGNPMGLDTKLEIYANHTLVDTVAFAKGEYRRHMVVRIPDGHDTPGCKLSVKAVNEQGASETLESATS